MKILVTGGAGFIGSHIVDSYVNLGHNVTVIDNLYSGKLENLNPKANFIELDITDNKILNLFEKEKFDIVSHHAAQMDVRLSVREPLFDANVNIIGGLNLYEAAIKTGVKKVIFASSGGTVYGEQIEFPALEEHPLNPCSPYGISKMVNEKYLFYYKEVYGLDFVAFRYGNVFGPRQNPHGEAGVIAIFIDKMLNNQQPIINGDGDITRDYIYVSDVIKANQIALNENVSGIFNITSSKETTVNEIFDILQKNINPNIKKVHGPAKSGEQRRSFCSTKKMKNQNNWTPEIDFENGINLTLNYYSENLKHK